MRTSIRSAISSRVKLHVITGIDRTAVKLGQRNHYRGDRFHPAKQLEVVLFGVLATGYGAGTDFLLAKLSDDPLLRFCFIHIGLSCRAFC
jgi:hypothetical protein